MFTMCFDHTHLPRLPPVLPDTPPQQFYSNLMASSSFSAYSYYFHDVLSPVNIAYMHIMVEPCTGT